MVLDDRTGHYPQPRGGRDGMCDDAFMWGMWLGRGDSCEQRRQQQEATETTTGSNRYNNREQPIQQQGATDTTTESNRYYNRKQQREEQGATERKAGGRLSFLKKS